MSTSSNSTVVESTTPLSSISTAATGVAAPNPRSTSPAKDRRPSSENIVFLDTAKNVPSRPMTPQAPAFTPMSRTAPPVAPVAGEMLPESPRKLLARQHAPPSVPHCCIVCDAVEKNSTDLHAHLLHQHCTVIADSHKIALFPLYLEHWKKVLKTTTLDKVAHRIPAAVEGATQNYFLISDVLPEDRKIRETLQTQLLNEMLELQDKERKGADIARQCLFCKCFPRGRDALFEHMRELHGFNIGQPDNVVGIDRLLAILRSKLEGLQCIYCERIFKDYTVLRVHMKKKRHFKISGQNKLYDQFYLINYLEWGKNWEDHMREGAPRNDSDHEDDDDDDDDDVHADDGEVSSDGHVRHGAMAHHLHDAAVSEGIRSPDTHSDAGSLASEGKTRFHRGFKTRGDEGEDEDDDDDSTWAESVAGSDVDAADAPTPCLFCASVLPSADDVVDHALAAHAFDFKELHDQWALDEYAMIKLVNFLRRCMQKRVCSMCYQQFETQQLLCAHVAQSAHAGVKRDAPEWQDDTNLMPVLPDDPMLCCGRVIGVSADDDAEWMNDPDYQAAREAALADRAEMIRKLGLQEM